MINYREIIIIDKVDIPILVYGDNCIVHKHINKESDMKDIDDQIVKKFIRRKLFIHRVVFMQKKILQLSKKKLLNIRI
ncbi:hypothetical protein CBEIBR21_19620 [Clostridium beijerinckii]|uniref:Uncharacterized protein n=1 Tax=Clostridium beijerinckii TaxID=1520 RepID=A0A1S9N373_CLOBE|nr:hypothetical protein CBEIBR21_19620 [Clostridium beijerinckii]